MSRFASLTSSALLTVGLTLLSSTVSAQNLPPPPPAPPGAQSAAPTPTPAPAPGTAPTAPAPQQPTEPSALPLPPPPGAQPPPPAQGPTQYPVAPQSYAPTTPPQGASDARPMWIVLQSDEPNLYVELIPEPEVAYMRQPAVRCQGSCTASVIPGKYTLRVTKPGEKSSQRTVKLQDPERLTVGAANPGASNAGLALGIAGPVMIVLSIALIFSELECTYDSDRGYDECDTPDWVPGVALIGILGGLAITPVGWVMFAKNKRPSVQRQPLPFPEANNKPSLRLGTFGVNGGGGLRVGLTF